MKINYLSSKTPNLWNSYKRDVSKILEYVDTDIKVVFDVGANTGGSTIALANGFPVANIHAFEPFNGNFKRLNESTASRNNIYTYNFGFYDKDDDEVKIGMPKIPRSNTHNYGRTTIHYEESYGEIDTVKMVDAGRWCVENNLIPDLLWMDIEGCEFDVIYSLRKYGILDKISYFYVEINPAFDRQNVALVPMMLSFNYEQIYISGKDKPSAPKNYLFKRKVTHDKSIQ